MRYSDDIIEEVRSRSDIVDVVGQYVSLKKSGSNYFGLCPFHSEKSPSFAVSPARQSFHCFGCGEGGSVFSFLMKYDSLSFSEAVKALADRAGMTLPDEDRSEKAEEIKSKKEAILAATKEAAIFYYRKLRSPEGEKGLAYFRGRGLTDETMHQFGLGFAEKTGGLTKYLKEKGYTDSLLMEAGLSVYDEERGLRDKFWNRVMFPIQDTRNRVIGFGGRVMGDGKPKYINSPDTPVFDKSNNLYGLNFAKNARAGYIILCEGNIDVIAMHQAGFNMAVASLGTAFTENQAKILSRYTDTVILAYDSDEAGTKAALRGIEILREAGLKGKVLDLRPHKDPDEFIKEKGKDAFAERVKNAEPPLMFEVRVDHDRTDMSDPEDRVRFYRDTAEKLTRFPDKLERDAYLEAVAVKYMIPADDLRQLMVSVASESGIVRPLQRPKSGMHRSAEKEDPARLAQRVMLSWLVEEPKVFADASKWIGTDDFEPGLYRNTASAVWHDLELGMKVNAAALIDREEDPEEAKTLAGILNEKLPEHDGLEYGRALREILVKIRESGNERRMRELRPEDPDYLTRPIEDKNRLEALRHADLGTPGNKKTAGGN